MRRGGLVLVCGVLTAGLLSAFEALPVFLPALAELPRNLAIPVRLPSKLPFGPQRIRGSFGTGDENSYWISLYYEEVGSNAAFAGAFGARRTPERVDYMRGVRLKSGIVARFLPVECGGSCAPANLWWEEGGVQYQIQLKLRSDMGERDQVKALVETADSFELVAR